MQSRIQAISGFGPAIAGGLVAWRKSLERRFTFNANQPINPADIAAIKAAIIAKQRNLEGQLRQCFTQLQKLSNDTIALRNSLRSSAVAAWNAQKQAETDKAELEKNYYSRTIRVAGLAAVVLGSVVLQNEVSSFFAKDNGSLPNQPQTQPLSTDRKTTAASNELGQNRPSPNTADKPIFPTKPNSGPLPRPPATVEPPRAPNEIAKADQPILPAKPDAGPLANPSAKPPGATQQPDTSPDKEMGAAPPLGPLQTIPSIPYGPASPREAEPIPPQDNQVASPLTAENVARIQTRLHSIGFLRNYIAGRWDEASRGGLRDFKVANRLPNTDLWDAQTEKSLYSSTLIRADQTFIGAWSTSSDCDQTQTDDPPLSINSKRAKSSGGQCDFQSVTAVGAGWRVRAICSVGPNKWIANINFTVSANQLRWTSEKGSETYFRCQ